MGFDGTATTAYFMYDYANFGNWGLAIAGIYLAVFLVFVNLLFKNDFNNMLSLNVLYLLWLSSAPFTSTLFSGGWVLMLLLYWLYKPLIHTFKPLLLAEKTV
jgi:ABC-type transport system involved in multi-copper enzyme maturation permease subunit